MSDLRKRLETAFAEWYHGNEYAPYAAPAHAARVDDCARCGENVDVALPVVVEWLGEKAGECRAAWEAMLPDTGPAGQRERGAELALLNLADEIERATPDTTGGQQP